MDFEKVRIETSLKLSCVLCGKQFKKNECFVRSTHTDFNWHPACIVVTKTEPEAAAFLLRFEAMEVSTYQENRDGVQNWDTVVG